MTSNELSGYGNTKSKKFAIVLYRHLSVFWNLFKNQGQIGFFADPEQY